MFTVTVTLKNALVLSILYLMTGFIVTFRH